MAESTLSLTYADLMNAVALRNGHGPDYTLLSAAKQARCDMAVQGGYRRFLTQLPILPGEREAHRWTFLRPIGTLSTVAPYTTGTITIAAGALTTVTLAGTGAVWPTWATDGELIIAGNTYAIASRDSNTQLTLAVNGPESAAGTAYSLQRRQYTMPDDFGSMVAPFMTFEPELGQKPVKMVSESRIRATRSAWNSTGAPKEFSIIPIMTVSSTAGQRFRLTLSPCADAVYLLSYRYVALISKLDATNFKYPLGGMQHGETIKAACLAYAEMIEEDRPGAWEAQFQQMLATSVSIDRNNNPDYYNYFGEGSCSCQEFGINTSSIVTYDGNPNLQ